MHRRANGQVNGFLRRDFLISLQLLIPLIYIIGGIFLLPLKKNSNMLKPIDKFEWTFQEFEMMEYAIIMNGLCTYGNPYGWLPNIGMDKVGDGPNFSQKVCPFPTALEIFSKRYNERELTNEFTYEEYLKQEEIQKLLEYFELDKDKFWFMLLFAYDFSESVCLNGIRVADSAYDQLQRFIETILPHVDSFDPLYGSKLDTQIEMTIRVNGVKGAVKIDSPTALHFLADSCKKRIEEEKLEDTAWIQYQVLQSGSNSLKESPTIFFFANMFLKWFNAQENVRSKRKKGAKHSIKERQLVSILIYFTELSSHESWMVDDEYLKSFLKQYKESDFWNRTSSIYPEHLLY